MSIVQLRRMSDLPFDRLPPHSARAEMRLLATIMLSSCPPLGELLQIVRHSDFFVARHRTLFGVMCELHDNGTPIDAMIVKERLAAAGLLEEIGGVEYLAQVLTTVPSAFNGLHYARMVREAADQREGRGN
jgi:replicative DNA helicase